MRIRYALLLALVAAITFVPDSHTQPSVVDYAVQPAPGSSASEHGDYFALEAAPGTSVTQSLFVRNDSKRPITLRVAAVDAATGPYGGVSYGLVTDDPTRVATWISFPEDSIRLAPNVSKRVPFTIAVPAEAASGEHLAGIAIWAPEGVTKPTEVGSRSKASASIVVQTRRVIAVLVTLPGPAEPRLVVVGVKPAARADGTYLEIELANRGGKLVKAARGVVALPGEQYTRRFSIDTFVPGTTTAYPVKWTQAPPEGEYEARVELRYDGRVESWEGSFGIGEELVDELVERGAARPAEKPRADVLVVAGVTGAGLVTVGVATALLLRRRRRHAQAHESEPKGDADDAGTAAILERIRSAEPRSSVEPEHPSMVSVPDDREHAAVPPRSDEAAELPRNEVDSHRRYVDDSQAALAKEVEAATSDRETVDDLRNGQGDHGEAPGTPAARSPLESQNDPKLEGDVQAVPSALGPEPRGNHVSDAVGQGEHRSGRMERGGDSHDDLHRVATAAAAVALIAVGGAWLVGRLGSRDRR